MMAEAAAVPYRAFASLEEAARAPDGFVIFEGDDGGQIYLVAPAGAVQCGEDALIQLLADLDQLSWADSSAAAIVYERHAVGDGIAGGMGGAVARAEPWLHPELRRLGIEEQVLDVLSARQDRLSATARHTEQDQ